MLHLEMPLADLVGLDWLHPQFTGGEDDGTGSNVPGVFGLAPMQTADFNVFPPPSVNIELGMMQGPMRTAPAEDVSLFTELLNGLDWANMPGGALFGMVQNEGEGGGMGGDGMDMDPAFDAGVMQEQPRSVTQNELFQQFLNMHQMGDGEGSDAPAPQQQQQPQFEQPTAVPPHLLMMKNPAVISTPAPAMPAPKYTPPRGAANFEKRRVAGSWKTAPRA